MCEKDKFYEKLSKQVDTLLLEAKSQFDNNEFEKYIITTSKIHIAMIIMKSYIERNE